MSGTLQPGDLLSQRYRVERELGRGAMGVVYLAQDLRHGRRVAVKVLEPRHASPAGADRFLDEIRTAAGLNHPYILPVHDSGDVGGRLYYVTPQIDGESLRERLDRQGALPVEEALRIVRLLADALSHAHARGVVHRDIKPENILLDRAGHPYLADFGVALSVKMDDESRRTVSGVAVGSPLYMSPEQAVAERDVDGRADLYALGCVLFEMLAGEHPFARLSPQAALARQLTEGPPRLRRRRADVPPWLDAVVHRSMASGPEDRYPTGAALVAALEAEAEIPQPGPSWLRRASVRRMAVALFILGIGGAAVNGLGDWGWGLSLLGGEPADTLRFAVLPFRTEGGSAAAFEPDLQLQDALGRWRELRVVDLLQVSDAVSREGGGEGGLSGSQALAVARRLGAGRYIHGIQSLQGDSLRVDAVLFEASRGRPIQQASVRVPLGAGMSDSASALLVSALLFGSSAEGLTTPVVGTNSVSARRAYQQGQEALRLWDLPRADSLFRAAVAFDPDFALAHVWVAQVGDWAGEPDSRWAASALRARRAASRLPPRERLLAEALEHMAEGRFPQACETYDALGARDGGDFAAWYGQGQCRARDPVLVPDTASPSGWSFRASYHRAVTAYRRAFEELPSSHHGFRSGGFGRVRTILFTRADRVKWGRAEALGDTLMMGIPSWSDTLALVPYRVGDDPPAEAHELALLQQRRVFREIAMAWTEAFPRSPDALHALAVSLEMLGDPAALETLLRARALVPSGESGLRLAASEVWLRVKLAVPERPEELPRARALADSLLADASPGGPEEASLLAGLAVLVGRPALAARYARSGAAGATRLFGTAAALEGVAAALEAFAAVGAPLDSLARLEEQAEGVIRRSISPSEQRAARTHFLENPALLAFPVHVFTVLKDTTAPRSMVGRAQSLWLRGDSAGSRALLSEWTSRRSGADPAAATVDVVFAEALLASAQGDAPAALASLAPTLDALRWVQPGMLEGPLRAGALVRAMALRAELMAAAGDRDAASRWAAAVLALWGGGEAAVEPTLSRMEALVPARHEPVW